MFILLLNCLLYSYKTSASVFFFSLDSFVYFKEKTETLDHVIFFNLGKSQINKTPHNMIILPHKQTNKQTTAK